MIFVNFPKLKKGEFDIKFTRKNKGIIHILRNQTIAYSLASDRLEIIAICWLLFPRDMKSSIDT